MCRASHLAGRAINVTRTTAAHALSYSLTARFGLRHGHAVALLLGQVLMHNSCVTEADVVGPLGPAAVRQRVAEVVDLCGVPSAEAVLSLVADLLNTGGLSASLTEAGIGPEHIASIAADVNVERLANNPRICTTTGLMAMLNGAAVPARRVTTC